MYRNTYVEIDNQIIEHNARLICSTFPHEVNIAVIKGNAYGHGYGVIPALINGGINAFAVSKLEEAVEARKWDSDHPVIMLQPVHKEFYKVCEEQNISVCLNDEETYKDIVESGCRLKVQLKIDSGMNRLGFKDKSAITRIYNEIMASDSLTLEGVFTHFHTSGLQDSEYEKDMNRFIYLTSEIDLSKVPMAHVDKTQTVILHETPSFANAARIGIALFGFTTVHDYPDTIKGRIRKLERKLKNKKNGIKPCRPIVEYDVRKAFTLYTEVIQLKKAGAGEYVGYGLFHKAAEEEYIAVIDIGYADGIGRKRIGSSVSINGKKYPIIGEVGMGMCEVLVDNSVKKYDRVTVFGGEIPIVTITRHLGTTMYELMTNIDSSIPRIYK